MDKIIQSTETDRRKESYVNNMSYTSPFAACIQGEETLSASNAIARYFSRSFITIARITQTRAEINTSRCSEGNSRASTMSGIVPLHPFQEGTQMDRAAKLRIIQVGLIISQRCVLIDTHLILSAIEAVPAASLAFHVLFRLTDLARQRAHALGWLRMSELELDLCKQTRDQHATILPDVSAVRRRLSYRLLGTIRGISGK